VTHAPTKLEVLCARFVVPSANGSWREVETRAEAQGIWFLCPLCFEHHGGDVGTHGVLVWFVGVGVPDAVKPVTRWKAYGLDMSDLSLSPSVKLWAGCAWHGWVRSGEAVPA